VVLLFGLNLLRIVSLFVTGIHFPSFFDALHEQVWGFILIPATLLLFLGWMQWALRVPTERGVTP
jgi:exosortase/archaeosortase family protein